MSVAVSVQIDAEQVADARALKAKLPTIAYQEAASMIHDWPIFTFAESRAAQAQMAAFIQS